MRVVQCLHRALQKHLAATGQKEAIGGLRGAVARFGPRIRPVEFADPVLADCQLRRTHPVGLHEGLHRLIESGEGRNRGSVHGPLAGQRNILLREDRRITRVASGSAALHANRVETLCLLLVECRLIIGGSHPVACHPGPHHVVLENRAIELVSGQRDIRRTIARKPVTGVLRFHIEGSLVSRRGVGVVNVPFHVSRVRMPDTRIAPVGHRSVNSHGTQDHVRVGRVLIPVIEGAHTGRRTRHDAMLREPRSRNPLLKNSRKDCVAAGSRRGNQYRNVTLCRMRIKPGLIIGAIHSVHRHPRRTRPLYPDRGVTSVARISVYAERNHPVALPG